MIVEKFEKNSFFIFLKRKDVKPIISKLFTALLLISEGVNVDLDIKCVNNTYILTLDLPNINFVVPLKKDKNFH